MMYLISSLIFLGIATAVFGFFDRKKRASNGEKPSTDVSAVCCGQHSVCELNNPFASAGAFAGASAGKGIEYFDDEELDAYRGIASDGYDDATVEEFREILYTLREKEVPDWLRSLQRRNINLPDRLKDEAFLFVEEQYKAM
ncbi:MAG: phospholipase [Tannerella sp.]|jgi:hypothetical protein|nr:phospholipase [Tannerella sp.]